MRLPLKIGRKGTTYFLYGQLHVNKLQKSAHGLVGMRKKL